MTLPANLLGAPQDVIPANAADFIQALLEGRVVHFAMVWEDEQSVHTQFEASAHPEGNTVKLLGALKLLEVDMIDSLRPPPVEDDDE